MSDAGSRNAPTGAGLSSMIPQPERPGRTAVEAAALFVGVFAVYAAGACPTVYVGDSGELVAAVHVLGIPHPTGYPLYVLLGKLWTLLLPFGSVAWRMSLFSAFFGAAACALLYRLCRNDGLRRSACVFAALLLAFAPSFWGEANVQRVYTLGAFFVVLATILARRWERRRDARALALVALCCGLGAANHTFMLLYAAAFGVFALSVDPGLRRRPREIAVAVAALLVGLAPYAYLPLRSWMNPPLDWGNPETFGAFLDVVLRRDFWGHAWIEGPADLWPIGFDYVQGMVVELAGFGALLAAFGAFAAGLRGGPLWLALAVMTVNLAVMAAHGSRTDIFVWHRYYIPSYVMAAWLAAWGADALARRLPGRGGWLPLLLVPVMLGSGWREFDRSRYRIAEDFSLALLTSLPPNTHLIASDDNILFVLIYLTMVEGQRPDLDLILPGAGDAGLPPLRFNPHTNPLYFSNYPNLGIPGVRPVPMGLAYQAWGVDWPDPDPVVPVGELAGERDPRVPKDYLTRELIGHFHYTVGTAFETRDWPRARREFEAALAAAPDNDVISYNVGLMYLRNGLLDEAIAAFGRSNEINPRRLPSLVQMPAGERLTQLAAEKERLARLESGLATDSLLAGADPVARHLRLAELLESRGETAAAHGHRLRALERR